MTQKAHPIKIQTCTRGGNVIHLCTAFRHVKVNTMAQREQVQWLDGQANVSYAVEKICPARHIRQNQWVREWNETYGGRWSIHYIPDYECIFNHPIDANVAEHERWKNLQAAKLQGTGVPITNLAHFMTEEVAKAIVKSWGIQRKCRELS